MRSVASTALSFAAAGGRIMPMPRDGVTAAALNEVAGRCSLYGKDGDELADGAWRYRVLPT